MQVLTALRRAMLCCFEYFSGKSSCDKKKPVMKKFVQILAILCASMTSSQAAVLNFDDLDATQTDVSLDVINPYAGFTWTNFFAYTSQIFNAPGFENGIVSGSNAAYSGGQSQAGAQIQPLVGSIQSTDLFDFTSVYLGAGNYDNLNLTISGLRSGSTLFSQIVLLNTNGASLFDFNFNGIDTLTFVANTTGSTADPFFCGSFNCTQFTLDEINADTVDHKQCS